MSFQLDHIDYVHANGFTALTDLSLQAKSGEQIALIGPSGAGKTTLLSLIGTRLKPTHGRLTVLNQTVDADNKRALRHLRSQIASIYQQPPLPGRQRVVTAVLAGRLGIWPAWKSLASLLYPMDIDGAEDVLSKVQLSEKLFDRCDQLSGGQLQRVGMARVLYQQGALVLADEPVSALDPGLALAIIQLLQQDARERKATLITSLHSVDIALSCFERIVGLRDGQIAFDLPTQQVTPQMLDHLYANESTAHHSTTDRYTTVNRVPVPHTA